MNPALEKQLELLAKNLASRRRHELPLPEDPRADLSAPLSPTPKAAERASAALDAGASPLIPEPIRESLESFSARQAKRVSRLVRPTALAIFGIVHRLACNVARACGYHRKAKQVAFFCPAELIGAHLGLSRGSFYRSLKELVAAGFLDARGHKTTLDGRGVRCDGTLWVVKLFPSAGRKPRFHADDFRGTYRDLAADIDAGDTVFRQVRQSIDEEKIRVSFETVLTWALPPHLRKTPLSLTVASPDRLPLEIVLDTPSAPRQERRCAVDRAANALAHQLGDGTSLNFYRYLVWQLLRLANQRRDHFRAVYQMAARAAADLREGFARSAGALFLSRLKASCIWEEVRAAPMVRVA